MIIGLKGLKNSGKDTVAAYLIKQHGFERKAFADPLKRSVAALLDIPYHEIDKWKNDPNVHVEVVQYASSEDAARKDGNFAFIQGPGTFRQFLQRMGDEASKQVWWDSFWDDLTLPIDGFYHGKKIVITDCRFESNARRVNTCGGYVVQLRRPGFEAQDPHRGEELFPDKMVDYTLMNDGTLDDLYDKINEMLIHLDRLEPRHIGGGMWERV